MLIDHFPPAGLRLRTPRLELRLPSPEQLAELAQLAAGGIHEPGSMPFLIPWTELPAAEIATRIVQRHWLGLGKWTPQSWSADFTVLSEGTVVGLQTLHAQDLAITGEVKTGSWLGLPHQGQGIGTEMRAAVLHLAFSGLGALEACSAAFEDNLASQRVSRKLGYQDDGVERCVVDGELRIDRRLRLTRADWERRRTVPVEIEGLAPCLPFFGLT
jgi:RimJ/RimL family protein N-acetyltransferase